MYEYEDDGRKPQEDESYITMSQDATLAKVKEDEQPPKKRSNESFVFTAVKNGVLEIIEKTLELFPVAINYRNEDKKSIVLLAVEHRQPHVYEFLLETNIYTENLLHQVDKNGNSALHWAATLDVRKHWLISGEALQMQWELKWYEFVKKSMPAGFVRPYNYNHETPDEIFTRTHMAFATSTTLPGGVDQDSGYPTLQNETAFNVFATSSLIALCCSVMAVVTFLSLLTSRFQVQDFRIKLPIKLLIGLTLLLMSITFMLVSFCAGHFFVLKHRLHHAGFTLYALTCLFVTFYVLSQFPLYFDFLRTTFVHVPQRGLQVMN
ncbi:hypothetical protein K1719_018579 [Acacia pycnantha]|nr:hypothetical protein K1719_018579 [Acacia pycnantha]